MPHANVFCAKIPLYITSGEVAHLTSTFVSKPNFMPNSLVLVMSTDDSLPYLHPLRRARHIHTDAMGLFSRWLLHLVPCPQVSSPKEELGALVSAILAR